MKMKETTEHVQQLPSETLLSETDMSDMEDSFKTKDVCLSERDTHSITETQFIEKSDSTFIPCAFVNTAFAGAELIDEVEKASPIRARSPYEVIRGETDKISDITLEEKKDISGSVERINYITRQVEIRRRPVLQHIPSEISEEDLVEREISPIGKDDLESFNIPVNIEPQESNILSEGESPDIKVFRTVTTTRVLRSSEEDDDVSSSQMSEPLEVIERKIPPDVGKEKESFEIPALVKTKVLEDDSSGVKVVKTVTTTRVVTRSGDYDDSIPQMTEPQELLENKIPAVVKQELESIDIPASVEKVVSEEDSSGMKVVRTITRIVKHSGDYDDSSVQFEEPEELLESKISLGVEEELESTDMPIGVETMVSEDDKSGMKVVRTITRVVKHSKECDDSTDQIMKPLEVLERKISPNVSEDIESFDIPADVETKVYEDESSGVKVVKTVTTTRVVRRLGDYDDSTSQMAKPQELLEKKIPSVIKQELESVDAPASIETVVSEEDPSGMKVVRTITRVVKHSGDYDDGSVQFQKPQELLESKISLGVTEELESADAPTVSETIVSEGDISGMKVVRTVTQIVRHSEECDDSTDKILEPLEVLEKKISPNVSEEIESFDTPAGVETKIYEDESSGVKVIKTVTTTSVVRRLGDYGDSMSQIAKPQELLESKIPSVIKQELESVDAPASIETVVSEENPSGMKVVRTITRVVKHSGDYDDGLLQFQEPQELLESKLSLGVMEELESTDSFTGGETVVSEDDISGVKVVRTITRVVKHSEECDDQILEPLEVIERKIPPNISEEIESFDIPAGVETKVNEDDSSGVKLVKTVTTTRVVRRLGDCDDSTSQMAEPQKLSESKVSSDLKEELGPNEMPTDIETVVSDDSSGMKVVRTITTTKVVRHPKDYDDSIGQIAESQELLEDRHVDVKEELKSIDIPTSVETMLSEDDSSGMKVVRTITTTRVVRHSGDYDNSTDQIMEPQELVDSKIPPGVKFESVDTPTSVKTVVSEDGSSCIKVIKTVNIISSENYDDEMNLSKELQDVLDCKSPSGQIEITRDSLEYVAKTDDITSPESDTGIPTSPFEVISESELSDGDHKSSALPLSQSCLKSEIDEKSQDSLITTTHSQSIAEKTISVSIASSKDQTDGCTSSELPELCESKVDHSVITTTSDMKPLTNGPGEVEYHAEYDYDGEIDKKYAFEDIGYSGRPAHETPEVEELRKYHYSNLSDDVIDSEIRDILDSDQQSDDIIERPVTPEPPKDDVTHLGFMGRNLKRPSEEAIEGLIRDNDFAYSDDPALSPTSPNSKSGFAYGMQFEKYALDQAEEAMDVDSDQYSEEKEPSYNYGMRFERDPDLEDEDIPCYGDLYTHEEEDEDALENGEKVKTIPKPVKDSEFDILAGRKYFTKNVEIDELSMSSLQEFERLEAEIVSGRKSSIGSVDSLNGKQTISKSGEHDDVSMSSLTEFERIERECTEGEKIDPSMQESITQLSEIEEGHESQASEASQENKSDAEREDDVSILEDYNNELENIEEIILKAESKKIDELPFQFMMKQSQKIQQIGDGTEVTYKEDKQIGSKVSDIGKQKSGKPNVTDISKVSSWTTSKSLESSSLGDAKDELDQDSLRDEVSLKPDSLIDDGKQDYQDSLHERFDDVDSLQEENLDEMRDSLFEERHIDDDSLHEMDIMPDESSLSLESSLPAVASLDSSKADDPVKLKVTNFKDLKDTQQELSLGTTLETFHIEGKTQINVTDLQRGVDVMQSSTDSLEQSSSAGLAAFHVESESLMSSSLNSAITSEDYTMISSTDTLEQEGRITYRYEDIPVDDIEMLVRSGQRVIVDSEGNIQTHYYGKQLTETDEITNTALCLSKDGAEVKIPPDSTVQVHSALTSVKYVNGDQKGQKPDIFHATSDEETDYTSFESSHFDPDVEVEEIETTDEFGNTKIIRKIKKVSHAKAQFSSSSSSKDVEEKMKEFLREHTAGDDAGTAKEEIEEERTTDDKGNVVVIRTVKQQIFTEPEVHSRTFTGPNADQQSQEFVETFQTLDPTEDVSEYEKIDEQGNVVRVTQKFMVTPQVHTVSFSGPDAHKQMEEYMKQWTLQSQNIGEFEGDEQRTILPALQMSRSSEQSEASIPTDISENLVQKVIGDTVVTKTVLSTFSTDSSEKIVKPESSTSTSISLETERVKPSDSTDDKTSAMPK